MSAEALESSIDILFFRLFRISIRRNLATGPKFITNPISISEARK
jgi:hypothetical protein